MGDKYSLKIPRELADLFQKYIDEHKELGYTSVSQFIIEVLRDKAKEILDEIK